MNIIVNKNFGKHNTSVRNGKIEYIVLHYVGAESTAAQNIAYFNRTSTKNASADFFVDFNGDIYQYNPDIKSRYAWSVGGKKQSSYDGSLYGIATNANTVNIEMCCRESGGSFSFEQATVDGARELVKKLMADLNIDADHVIRHADVNGKRCPNVYGWLSTTGSTAKWDAFKASLTEKPAPAPAPSTDDDYGYTDSGKPSKETKWIGTVDVESWDVLNGREWAGVEYGIVETFPAGSRVNVQDRRYANDGAAWYYVQSRRTGKRCFVNAHYVVKK